jgi:MFS family permease
MMLKRGVVPAWMEILKLNMQQPQRQKVFAYGSAVSYLGGIFLPILIGDLLDVRPGIWRFLFPLCALLGLGSIFSAQDPPPESCSEKGEGAMVFERQAYRPVDQRVEGVLPPQGLSAVPDWFFSWGLRSDDHAASPS